MTDRTFRMSAINSFKWCRRNFWLSYGRNLVEQTDPDKPASGRRDVGTMFHTGAAAIYRGQDWQSALDSWVQQQVLTSGGTVSKEWATEIRMVEAMLRTYVDWLEEEGSDAGEHTLITPDGIEHIEHRLTAFAGTYHGDNVYVTGEPDRLVVDEFTGLVIIDDLKTVDSLLPPATLSFDFQGLTYEWLAAMNGIQTHQFRHTQVKKNMRTARSNPPWFARHPATFTDPQREAHRRHLAATIGRMVEALQGVEADPAAHHEWMEPTPNKDCSWRCPFINVCPMMDQGDDWEGALSEWFTTRTEIS